MPKRSRHVNRKKPAPIAPTGPPESRAADVVTIAWTVSVTSVFAADLMVIAAHLYSRVHPDARPARTLEAIMLLAAALMGAVSLALLPVVWRARRIKPPRGFITFAILVAVAPIVALVSRLLS